MGVSIGRSPLCRVIGSEVDQPHIGVPLFGLFYHPRRQMVKVSVLAYCELSHTIFDDVLLYQLGQSWDQTVWCVPMPNEKAGACDDMTTPKFRLIKFIIFGFAKYGKPQLSYNVF